MIINKKSVVDFENALLDIDRIAAEDILNKSLVSENGDIFKIIDSVISPALESIGRRWANGDIALSQEYMASKIAEDITLQILPAGSLQRTSRPVIGITTLEDQHMLGKQILRSLISSLGFNFIDYGSVSIGKIKEKIISDKIEILFISTLMLNQALSIKEVTSFIEQENIGTKVIVGGAPFLFDEGLWKEVNASAMARTAAEGMHIAQEMVGEL